MVSDEHLKMRETEKGVRWLRDINPRAFSWWAGRRDSKNRLKGKPFHVGGLRIQTSPFS